MVTSNPLNHNFLSSNLANRLYKVWHLVDLIYSSRLESDGDDD